MGDDWFAVLARKPNNTVAKHTMGIALAKTLCLAFSISCSSKMLSSMREPAISVKQNFSHSGG